MEKNLYRPVTTKSGLELTPEVFDKINNAIESLSCGLCSRVDVHQDIKVYLVKNVIRVDIKMS